MTKAILNILWILGLIAVGMVSGLTVYFVMRGQLSNVREEAATEQTALQSQINDQATQIQTLKQAPPVTVPEPATPAELSDEEAITKYLTAKCHGGGAAGTPDLNITIENNFAAIGVSCDGPGFIQWMKKTEGVWFETFAGQNAPTQSELDLWDFPSTEKLGTADPRPE